MKYFKVILILLISMNFSIYASDCYKKVSVKETRTSFKANVLMPKIVTTQRNTEIYITCKMHDSSSVGDEFYLPEPIKKFNEEKIFGFIPYGTMDKVRYKLLSK